MKILVLNANALHVGYLGPYGNEWVATPALDRLAAEGVVFDQHYADSPGAARSSWTGRYQFPLPEPAAAAPPEPAPDLRALLESQGVPFEVVGDPGPAAYPEDLPTTPLERTLEAALEALASLGLTERWLIWVDLPDLRPPWQVAEGFLDRYFVEEPEEEPREEESEEGEVEPLTPLTDAASGPIDVDDLTLLGRLQGTYAAAVTQLDAGIGVLMEELGQQGVLDGLTLLVTADCGLPLGEHGVVGVCRPWLHDELIHLPLFLRLPGGADAGLRISALTQPVDLPPTLLDLLGLPAPPSQGQSLMPLIRGEKEQVRDYACAGLELNGGLEWALRTPDWGFLLPLRASPDEAARGPQLYAKPDDRWEVNNVAQHHLDYAEGLEQTLRGFVAATQKPGVLDAPALPAEEEGGPSPDLQPGA